MLKDFVHEAFARQWSIIGDRVNLENTAKTIAEAIDSIANIVCTDTEGYILYANRIFCEINKCELNDIIVNWKRAASHPEARRALQPDI